MVEQAGRGRVRGREEVFLSRAEIFLIEIIYSKYFEARRFTFCIFKILESTAWRVRDGPDRATERGSERARARERGRRTCAFMDKGKQPMVNTSDDEDTENRYAALWLELHMNSHNHTYALTRSRAGALAHAHLNARFAYFD